MPYELEEIKEIRKKFGLTQSELAKRAGVSQSLIAKIEANMLDPGYSKTKQIFDALENLTQKEELTAQQIMQKKMAKRWKAPPLTPFKQGLLIILILNVLQREAPVA